jgi:hypothetical protein
VGLQKGFRCVHAVAHFLGGTLGSNCCKAFRFVLLLALEVRQGAQLANNLLVEPLVCKEGEWVLLVTPRAVFGIHSRRTK